MDRWAEVVELEAVFSKFLDVVETLRLFRHLRPCIDLAGEFVYGG
jgi:hypothetical protein